MNVQNGGEKFTRSNAALELICPAGTPSALKTAIEAGADAVYVGFRDETNARNFPGLNFSRPELEKALDHAHGQGRQILLAVNTFAQAGQVTKWHEAIDDAARLGVDALIIADIGMAAHAAEKHPDLRLHLSVQAAASSPEAINFYQDRFNIKRVVLPRVLTVPEIKALNQETEIETEVFVFGGLCVMAEGRCALSSYATGKSPNMNGACSPASHVEYRQDGSDMVSRLGEYTINRFAQNENAGYPTLCKGRFTANDETGYIFEEPTSLNALDMLPELLDAGVTALKIEGRQRSRAYVREVVQNFRRAVDAMSGRSVGVDKAELASLAEGQAETGGVYNKTWR